MTAKRNVTTILAAVIVSPHHCERSKGKHKISKNNAQKGKKITFCKF